MKVEKLAHQRPAIAFARGGWYLDTPLFQGLAAHAVFVDETGRADGTTREEGSRGRESQSGNVFQRNRGKFFSALRLPPTEGGKEREKYLSPCGNYS
jgi:hypothetical protein